MHPECEFIQSCVEEYFFTRLIFYSYDCLEFIQLFILWLIIYIEAIMDQ